MVVPLLKSMKKTPLAQKSCNAVTIPEILLWQNSYGLPSSVSKPRWKDSAPQLDNITNTNEAMWKKKQFWKQWVHVIIWCIQIKRCEMIRTSLKKKQLCIRLQLQMIWFKGDRACQCISRKLWCYKRKEKLPWNSLNRPFPFLFILFCRATLKDGREVCLDPTAPWVKLIIKAILDKWVICSQWAQFIEK